MKKIFIVALTVVIGISITAYGSSQNSENVESISKSQTAFEVIDDWESQFYVTEIDDELFSQNCNNKLHTFAPHHTCGVKS